MKVELSSTAKKDLNKLHGRSKKRAYDYVDALSKFPNLGLPLTGNLKGYYRIKIPPLRIIYTVNKKEKVIRIVTLGVRENIYKKLRRLVD